MLLRFGIIVALVSLSAGYREFQDRIPNGDQVPHPCKPNFIWRGVGHLYPLGGGARNPFGLDFFKHDKRWTKELCQADSDGDGLTNGQELGDPDCTWTPGTFAKRNIGISHPGVCDPWGSPECKEKNADVTCDTGEFNCPYVEEPHVRNITLRFPKSVVPAVETSYMCMSFDLEFPDNDPPDQEYHIIATEPIIDNPNVMHHITLFSCNGAAKQLTEPALCYMSQAGCYTLVGLWTLGMPGECHYKDAGFKISRGHKTKLMMQFHWTNPERVPDYEDESGMIVYYTPVLRKYNAGLFMTGQTKLVIPPGQSRVVETSTCSSDCTNKLIVGSAYLTTGLNHMHYLAIDNGSRATSTYQSGIEYVQSRLPVTELPFFVEVSVGERCFQQNVELYRDDKKMRDLAKDDVYSYDNPIIHVYDPPQLLLPGDRLDTTCVYRSLSRTKTSYFGEGTYDEMCYGIFTAFPVENITSQSCTSWGRIESCKRTNGHIYNCNIRQFTNLSDPETAAFRHSVLDNCNFHGPCRPECPAALAKAREHPCLQGEVGDYVLWGRTSSTDTEDIKFLAALASCDCSADIPVGTRTIGEAIGESNSGRRNLSSALLFLISTVPVLVFRN